MNVTIPIVIIKTGASLAGFISAMYVLFILLIILLVLAACSEGCIS
jgi:hypothetical protein